MLCKVTASTSIVVLFNFDGGPSASSLPLCRCGITYEELRDKVQEALNEMAKEGFISELSDKYFSYDSCALAACEKSAE